MINGLYDAQMDHVPVVALLGQVATTAMNYNSFQELNENPIFADVSVYNRTVMTPESLPHVVDEAIKAAYENKGVAIVTIPVDLGFADIEEEKISNAATHKTGTVLPDEKDVIAALPFIEKAKSLYFTLDKVLVMAFHKSKILQNTFPCQLLLLF